MSAAKSHPHIDSPTQAQLEQLVEDRSPTLAEVYLDLHRLVLATVPGISFSVDCEDAAIGYGAHQYGYNGWGMAAITPYRRWVSIGFLAGAQLDDPEGLLEGSGSAVRHVKLRSHEEFAKNHEAIARMISQATQLKPA